MLNNEEFKHVGHVSVDAGCVWIGDPCYILKDRNEDRPTDLGKDWSDFSDRFLNRIGYTEENEAFQAYHNRATLISHGFDPEHERVINYNHQWLIKFDGDEALSKKEINDDLTDAWIEQNPFISPNTYTGVAVFNHDAGHAGLGICTDTNEGDGSYPVYIKYGKNGRPSKVLIDFGDN